MPENDNFPPAAKDGAVAKVFPIVGIGASAGGLEAFSEFFEHLPVNLGMAYVLVQHLDPSHESLLARLIADKTRMPVREAADGMAVMPDHVYVIPPNVNLAILHGVLHLMPPAQPRALTIDYFLRALAEDAGSRAVGVILSGTASDGAVGIKAIKAEGGITFAQEPKSARYDGMPQAAIATGVVDFVLPPQGIGEELARIAGHVNELAIPADTAAIADEDSLQKIFILLRRRTGVDFAYYKPTTIQRRVRRRMLVHKLDKLPDYVRLLNERASELDILYNEILINVTAFFRDPESFESLAREVFPKIVRERDAGDPIRIWVPGCSTGEEPYSLAIALLEYMDQTGVNLPVQIFATDIDSSAIDKARAGVYPESVVADLSPRRLSRYFTKSDNGYVIAKYIRDMCLFARQNVAKDPPFSRLDLVSCRNLMIYLGPVLQKKVLSLFHYALKPTGFLFLGVAETIGKFGDMYRLVDSKNKIYAKKSIATPLHFDFSTPSFSTPGEREPAAERPVGPVSTQDLAKTVDRVLTRKYCPPTVVINEQMDIVQFRGSTGEFLEPAPGEASFNLLRMAREGLAMDLREAVAEAIRARAVVRREGLHLRLGETIQVLDIEVAPLSEYPASDYYLVLFQAREPLPAASDAAASSREAARIRALEQELAATKDYLQSVIEQDETINEELRSANEEILSSNEELQSTNEELETAKEELQSVNEELSTVNEELESRNAELSTVNNDLNNLIGSVSIPILIVERDLRIRRFSPQAQKYLNLRASDIGRPISDINLNVRIPNLEQLLHEVVETVSTRELDLQGQDGRWYSMRLRPYRTLDNKIDGAVVCFIDIDDMRKSLQLAKEARDYAEGLIAAIGSPMLVLDGDLRVVSANPAFLETFQVTEKDTRGNLLYRLGNGQWGIPGLRALLEKVCQTGEGFDGFDVEHEFEAIGRRSVRVSGRAISSASREARLVLMQIEPTPPGTAASDGKGA